MGGKINNMSTIGIGMTLGVFAIWAQILVWSIGTPIALELFISMVIGSFWFLCIRTIYYHNKSRKYWETAREAMERR